MPRQAVVEPPRPYAVGDTAQLGNGVLEIGHSVVELALHCVVRHPVLDGAQPHPDGQYPRLRTVMQVAFQTAPFLGDGGDQS